MNVILLVYFQIGWVKFTWTEFKSCPQEGTGARGKNLLESGFILRGGATVPIFKTQLRSVFPGPPIYFTDFIFCMVISYYHIRMGI